MEEQFSRTAMLLGEDGIARLKKARVAVFGLGGVGGYVVEALARSGIGQLDLIDKDTDLEHVNDKVRLCAMVKQLAAEAKELPCSKAGNPLCELAAVYESKASEIFDELGIPASYPVTFDEDELGDLLEADLFEPEEVG